MRPGPAPTPSPLNDVPLAEPGSPVGEDALPEWDTQWWQPRAATDGFEAALDSAIEVLRSTLLSQFRDLRPPPAGRPPLQMDRQTESWHEPGGYVPKYDSEPRKQFMRQGSGTRSLTQSSEPAIMEAGGIRGQIAPGDIYMSDPDSSPSEAGQVRHTESLGSNTSVANIKKPARLLPARLLSISFQTDRLSSTMRSHELLIAMLIALNAMWMGVMIQYLPGSSADFLAASSAVSAAFCVAFVADLAARLRYQGSHFFKGAEAAWNWFDTLTVTVMVVDTVHIFLLRDDSWLEHVTIIRIVRVTRLLRVVRALRVFSSFAHFRSLVSSIQESSMIFIWVLVLSIVLAYSVGLIVTEATMDHCLNVDVSASLCDTFGSLSQSTLSHYMAMYDGVLWGELLGDLEPLPWTDKALFLLGMSFLKIVVVNLVVGTLMGISSRARQKERDSKIIDEMAEIETAFKELRNLFVEIDLNHSGALSLDEFELALEDPRIEAVFRHLKMDTGDARKLFEMLDVHQDNAVDIEEFVGGALNLRGDARQIDVIVLQKQCSQILSKLQQLPLPFGVSAPPPVDAPARKEPGIPRARMPTRRPTQSRSGRLRDMFSTQRGTLEQPEMRAMTLDELRQVRTLVHSICPQENWRDVITGEPLVPTSVNLYHFVYHYVNPQTAPDGIVLLCPDCPVTDVGSEVVQLDQEGLCWGRGRLLEMTDEGPKIQLLKGCFRHNPGRRLLVGGVEISPLTGFHAPNATSYKELVSPVPTAPTWYCSHWWGQTVIDFVDSCEEHARLRTLHPATATYWVCGYAHRQHSLDTEIGQDPEQTSFRRAMALASGVLLHLDDKATAFTRIWCDFELFCTVSDDSKELDIVTIHRGVPHLLSGRKLPNETARSQTMREAHFPISLLVNGMTARLQDGSASVESDKDAILRHICSKATASDQEPLQSANDTLHAIFARAAWPQAVKRGLVEDFDRKNPGVLRLPDVLRRDENQRSLHMSLEHLDMVTDDEVANLAEAFPPNLFELVLSFEGCVNVSSRGLEAIALQLQPRIRLLKLDFLGCPRVGDTGLQALALRLPEQLQELHLHFDRCHDVSVEGLRVLAERMPRCIKKFKGTFLGTKVGRNFNTAREIQSFTGGGGMMSFFETNSTPWPSMASSKSEASGTRTGRLKSWSG